MEQKQFISVLFYIRKAKSKNGKQAPIYLRITVNGLRAEISIQRDVEITKWNPSAEKMQGTSETVRTLNQYINFWRQQVFDTHEKILKSGQLSTANSIKQMLTGNESRNKTLLDAFRFHNSCLLERVGIDHAKGTYDRYKTALDLSVEFMKVTYGIQDILLSQLTKAFAVDFYHYMITVRRCNTNTSAKYVKNLKRITRYALLNEWITRDPFMGFSPAVKPVDRGFLTKEELKVLEEKKMSTPRLEQVRDIFVFSCYTGLAYIDVVNLRKENLTLGFNGDLWINTFRQKTNIPSNIPLLPKTKEIIEKYKNHPQTVIHDRLLPILSNQKMNAYLKEIADICGITKNLTFHLARHTFATTITLTNGVSIESVSAMLGHTNIKTTQIYAKVVKEKVAEEMEKLSAKLANSDTSNSPKRKDNL